GVVLMFVVPAGVVPAGWYDPRWHYEHEDDTREALDLIFSGHFNRREPRLFDPIRDALLAHGDYYMHLADLASYTATQSRVAGLYADRGAWGRKAILNVGCSGKFSSDRTIAEYASSIWGGRARPGRLGPGRISAATPRNPRASPPSVADGRSRGCPPHRCHARRG